jgi:hypothetical protein
MFSLRSPGARLTHAPARDVLKGTDMDRADADPLQAIRQRIDTIDEEMHGS